MPEKFEIGDWVRCIKMNPAYTFVVVGFKGTQSVIIREAGYMKTNLMDRHKNELVCLLLTREVIIGKCPLKQKY